MKAVILAAGEGTRLMPLTENRPKPLIPIAGRPLLELLMRSLRECSISEILLIVGKGKDIIAERFGDGSKLGVTIEYVVQTEVNGTAGAMKLAKDFAADEPVVAMYGDILVSSNEIRRVIETFKQSKSAAAMAVAPSARPEFYGSVQVQKDLVKEIVEKPSAGKAYGNLVNVGIYVFSPSIFESIELTGRSERGEYEITDSLKLMLEKGEEIRAVELEKSSWVDVGRPWDVLDANALALAWLTTRVEGEIEQGARLIGSVVVERGARVRSGSYVEGPALIMGGADIGPNCYIRPFTTIGRNSRIGNACEVKNSIIMDETKVPHLSYIGDSIIGERCNFGAGTIVANLRLDEAPIMMMVKDTLVDTGKRKLGVIVGDDVETGVNCSLMPGIKIGSRARIGPGMVVSRDVPSGSPPSST